MDMSPITPKRRTRAPIRLISLLERLGVIGAARKIKLCKKSTVMSYFKRPC